MEGRRPVASQMMTAYRAAIDACDPERATARELAGLRLPDRVRVLALGKAAIAMVRGADRVLGDRLVGGLAVSDHGEYAPARIEVLIGAHPSPDRASVAAGRRLLADAARTDVDLLLVLVSGGGSAVADVPLVPLTIDGVAATTAALVQAGVPIDALNTVRRHLSELKNGGLLRAARVPVLTLLVSDVSGADPSVIASGPTLRDASTSADALDVLDSLDVPVDPAIRAVLEAEELDRSPLSHHEWIVIADDETAARGASDVLDGAPILTSRLNGPADVATRTWLGRAPAGYSVLAGETTVHVTPGGKGGRNQHAALTAALEIDGTNHTFAALGTDGRDGPTDAAGAIVDGATARAIRAAGIDPVEALRRCDSYPALDAAGALVRTGPTGTNVGDLWMIHRSSGGQSSAIGPARSTTTSAPVTSTTVEEAPPGHDPGR